MAGLVDYYTYLAPSMMHLQVNNHNTPQIIYVVSCCFVCFVCFRLFLLVVGARFI